MKPLFIILLVFAVLTVNGFAAGSREGDSLALVAIKNANPESFLKWDESTPLEEWGDNSKYKFKFKNNRLTTISFNNASVKALPPEISNLTLLDTLTISEAVTLSLPSEIGQLSALKYLLLSGVNLGSDYTSSIKLAHIPAEISNLKNLRTLRIAYATISELPPAFCNLSSLEHLGIAYADSLKTLPSTIGNLTNLKTLELNIPKFAILPPEIGNLVSLDTLNIHSGSIKVLPSTLDNLPNLSYLRLWTSLTTLPPEISNINSLKHLEINSTELTTLPAEIGNMSNLKVFFCRSGLTTLPASFKKLSQLTALGLSKNKLNFTNLELLPQLADSVSRSISPQLIEAIIDTSQSPILVATSLGGSATIYEWYRNDTLISSSSNTLDLNEHGLKTGAYKCIVSNPLVPELVFTTENYMYFSSELEGTLFEDSLVVRAILDSLPLSNRDYQSLPIRQWPQVNISSFLFNKDRVERLSLETTWDNKEAKILPIINNLTALQRLELNVDTSLRWPDELYTLPNVEEITLISRFEITQSLKHFPKLVNMTLSRRNSINDLAPISLCTKLESLTFDTMDIGVLPVSYQNLTNLRILRFNNGKSDELPPIFKKMTSLHYLRINNSNIKFLPDNITMTNPTNISFAGGNLQEENLTNAQITWLDSKDPDWRDSQKPLSITYKDAYALELLRKLNPQASWNWSKSIPYQEWEGVVIDPVLNRVTELDISNKNVSALSSSICLLDKLTKLNVSNNKLESIPAIIYKNTLLRSIDASNNKLTLLFKDISSSKPTLLLDVSHNYLKEMYLEEPVIEWLDTYANDWRSSQTGTISSSFNNADLIAAEINGNRILLTLPQSGRVTIKTFNLRGQLLNSIEKHCNSGINQIPLSKFTSTGFYIAHIISDEGEIIQKFITK